MAKGCDGGGLGHPPGLYMEVDVQSKKQWRVLEVNRRGEDTSAPGLGDSQYQSQHNRYTPFSGVMVQGSGVGVWGGGWNFKAWDEKWSDAVQPASQPINQNINQSISQLCNQLNHQQPNQVTNKNTNQTPSKLTNRSINQNN